MSLASEPVIEAKNLSKTYRLYGNPYHRLLEKMPWNKRPRIFLVTWIWFRPWENLPMPSR